VPPVPAVRVPGAMLQKGEAMKQLRVAGVKLESVGDRVVMIYDAGFSLFLPGTSRRFKRRYLTAAEARRISRWFADLAEELEKRP